MLLGLAGLAALARAGGASTVARGAVGSLRNRAAGRVVLRALANDEGAIPAECAAEEADEEEEDMVLTEPVAVSMRRRQVLAGAGAGMAAAAVATTDAEEAVAAEAADGEWVQYDLNTGETLYDIDFDDNDTLHGFVVGARGLFYETKDGGKRWVSRSFSNLSKGQDEIKYRFQNVSILDKEVWIVGKPSLLLHSKDGGKSWKKVPLSKKLPGTPQQVLSLGPSRAEMATSSGAVYLTENDGKNWASVVKETVDATLNRVTSSGISGGSYFTGSVKSIKRNPEDGKYIAVAQRGNFYLTYNPGEPRWIPHNRVSARRIQAMGFRQAGASKGGGPENKGVWMSLNGGYFMNCSDKGYTDLGSDTKSLFKFSEIRTGGIGIIDAAYRTASEGWAVGGSAVIYVTKDAGKTWQFDTSGNELPCNLYNVKFFNKGKYGYMIGSSGILLRRVFPEAAEGSMTPAPV